MAEGPRPGGLTALAVLNFVFGAFGLIGSLLVLGGAATLSKLAGGGAGIIYLAGLLSLVGAALLIVSGIGYLGQKKVLGRMIGNVYGGVAILGSVVSLAMIPNSFGIGT